MRTGGLRRAVEDLSFWFQFVLAIVGAALFWRAEHAYAGLERLELSQRAPQEPNEPVGLPISIVIPARNEAANLSTLLPTLANQNVAEILVVDDDSSDATAAVASEHGARVLPAESLPEGWTGKSHACAVGAAAARAEWLLFLDADTALAPGAVNATFQYATERGADAVSCLLDQQVVTFWEKLILPLAYHQLFTGLAFGTSAPVLNGQFVLVRRDVYLATEGHAAPSVRGAIVEDLALGRLLVARGARLVGFRGEAIGRVRMYDSLGAIREGFGKNAAAIVGANPGRGVVIAIAAMASSVIWPLAFAGLRRRGSSAWLAAFAWLLHYVAAARWNQDFLHMGPGKALSWAALRPLAAVVFQSITIESLARSYLTGHLAWKGRHYGREAARWRD